MGDGGNGYYFIYKKLIDNDMWNTQHYAALEKCGAKKIRQLKFDSNYILIGKYNSDQKRSTNIYELESSNEIVIGQSAGMIKDTNNLVSKYGDKLYKISEVSEYLDTQAKLQSRAIALLKEVSKNYEKIEVEVVSSAIYNIGETLRVVDSIRGIDTNYFIEEINDSGNSETLTLARYA